MTTLKDIQIIAQWDRRSTQPLQEIYREQGSEPEFLSQLIALLPSAECQSGASWLIKHALENGQSFSQAQTAELIRHVDDLEHWTAILHVLQCASHWLIPSRSRKRWETFVSAQLRHSKPFVRAWAYDSFCHLARQYPEYRTRCRDLLQNVSDQEAASVKARIRNLRKDNRDL